MKRILSVILCLIMLVMPLTSCENPPDIEEIRPRIGELIEASYGVNVYLFGEGHKTYERVYDPKDTMQYYEAEGGQRYYYYFIEDEAVGTVLAYRTKSYGNDYEYLQIAEAPDTSKTAVYEGDGKYYYSIEYTPVEREFYYNSLMPEDYDVVVIGEKYASVDEIKAYAESVYSAEYLAEIYETLFTGILTSDDIESGLITARYIDYENENGTRWFMESNKFKPLMTEQRIYDVSTAKILRGSSKTRVRVEIDTYLPSEPDVILPVAVNLVKQNGEWYLDSGTY